MENSFGLRAALGCVRLHAAALGLLSCCVLTTAWVQPASAQTVQWAKSMYGYLPTSFYPGGVRRDYGSGTPYHKQAVGMDAAGNVFATGGTWSSLGAGQDFTCKTYKYAASTGAVLWERNYAPSPAARRTCRLIVDSAGDVYLGADARGEFKIIKYSGAAGAVLWEGVTTGGGYDQAWSMESQIDSMALDGNGNVLATGSWYNGSGHQLRTAKFSATGAVVWDRLRTTSAGIGHGIGVDAAGNAIVAGWSLIGTSGAGITLKYAAADGTVLWEKFTGGTPAQEAAAMDVAVDAAGNVVTTGYNGKTIGYIDADTFTARDMRTVKYAGSDGAVIWDKTFAAPVPAGHNPEYCCTDMAYNVSLDAAGNAFVSGSGFNSTSYGTDFKTIKYAAADGAVLWERATSGATGYMSIVYSSKVDASGNLVVAGTLRQSGNNDDMRTIKYRGSDGAVLWQNDYAGTGNSGDSAYAVAMDPNGHVAVAGYSGAAGSGFKVIKYWSTGVKVWENAPVTVLAQRYSYGARLGLDPSGNLIAAGGFWGYTEIYDDNEELMLHKFSSTDGAVLWSANYLKPLPDYLYGFAVDASGNVLIASQSTFETTGEDFNTLKFSGANGQILWNKTYDNPAHSRDRVQGIAIDAAGNAFVAGDSESQGKMIKYNSATGAVLWESTYGNSGGYAGVAVDATGNAFGWDYDGMVKRSGANGTLMWQASVSQFFYFYSLVLDGQGNPVFIGNNGGGSRIFKIGKYSGANGTQAWLKTITEPVGSFVSLSPVTVDSGNNVVTAWITYKNVNSHLLDPVLKVVKLSASTGDVLWQRTFDSTLGELVPAVHAISVDPRGNVLVGGRYKLAAATGATVWVFQPNMEVTSILATSNAIYLGGSSTEPGSTLGMRVMKIANDPDSVPDAFGFAPQSNVGTSVPRTSNTVAPLGYDMPATISVTGGEYSIGCTGTFTNASGTIQAGASVCVRHVTASTAGATVTTTLTIGGVSGTFSTTTSNSPRATSDFSGDGRSDILWYNNATGRLYELQMNGLTVGSGAIIDQETDLNWKVAAVADLNGDGRADLVWHHTTTGQVYALLMNGNTVLAEGPVYVEPNTNWKIAGAGDFNGDGNADLLWKNTTTGDVFLLMLNGLTVVSGGVIYSEPNANWAIQKVADFNGDGRADIVWRNTATGDVFMMLMNGTLVSGGGVIYAEPNVNWQIQAAADFDGDGRADILWRNVATGDVFMMLMNGLTVAGGSVFYSEPNADWKIVASGDYDGDGRADILWRNTATGQVFMMLMNGFTVAGGGFVYTEPDTQWQILGP